MKDILYKIEETTKFVSQNSKDVRINYNRLDEIIEVFDLSKNKHWLESNPFGILDMDVKNIINFLLIYHTIGDYCFWGEPKWTIKIIEGELDGSFAMMYLVINRLKSGKNFDMSFEEFSDFLKANTEIPLLEDRYNNLVLMNKFLRKNGNDFYSLIKDIYDDKTLFEYVISNLEYFKDESEYKEEKIYFYKRAQLLVSDVLHIREKLENVKVDYSNLCGCADYKIPQVMRCFGILEFSRELSNLVDNKVELKEDSNMEVEIRANDIVVIDYIYKKLNKRLTRMDINDYIWLLGQDKSKMVKPYHRTLTNHY